MQAIHDIAIETMKCAIADATQSNAMQTMFGCRHDDDEEGTCEVRRCEREQKREDTKQNAQLERAKSTQDAKTKRDRMNEMHTITMQRMRWRETPIT